MYEENAEPNKILFNFKQIENLSNYEILLTNDIIEYSSMVLNKNINNKTPRSNGDLESQDIKLKSKQ